MLPQTTQAKTTEVEGDTTVVFSGAMGDGTSLEEAASQEPGNETADSSAEEAQVEAQAETESDTEPTATTEPPRKERRMEKLIDNLKSKTDEVSELRKRLEQNGAPVQYEQNNLPPWLQSQGLPIGEEVTPEELNARVLSTAHALVKTELAGYAQAVKAESTYKDDLHYVEGKYDILNQESDSYDPGKSKTVAQLFQKASASDPTLRLKDFVDQIMSFHQAGEEIGKQEIKSSVVMREAQQAVSPSQSGVAQSKNSDWDSMTLKEKEQWMKDTGNWE